MKRSNLPPVFLFYLLVSWQYQLGETAFLWKRPAFSVSRNHGVRHDDKCQSSRHGSGSPLRLSRGGDQELTLDQKVAAAMKRLGLQPPQTQAPSDDAECEGGVCPTTPPPPPPPPAEATDTKADVEPAPAEAEESAPAEAEDSVPELIMEDQVEDAAIRLASDLNVDRSLAMAALSATSTSGEKGRMFDEEAARAMVQHELEMVEQIPADAPQVHTLVGEGFETFLVRRALAFAEGNMDDARAILLADQEDEQAEDAQRQELEGAAEEEAEEEAVEVEPEEEPAFKTVTVDSKIDPTQLTGGGEQPNAGATSSTEPSMPKAANKADVVFEATSNQVQELVLESPVPVLLDVYADWCGPCKVLTPALEDMAVKSGGMFRLVKVNSDIEKAVSTALEVTALPSVFGVKNGRIVHMFQGMPTEDSIKNFMMGLLVGESSFAPALTSEQKDKYQELTTKLVKMAGAASFSFSARERLQDRVGANLEKLVEQCGGDASKAEESAKVVRSLLSNIIRNPTEAKFRSAKLSNAVMQAKIAPYPAALALLKSAGFRKTTGSEGNEVMTLGSDSKFINVAPLTVARDAIDKWIDKSRYEIAKAARKRKDEEERDRLIAEGAFDEEEEEEDDAEMEEQETLSTCLLKVRLAGKKKVYSLSLAATDRLSTVLDQLPVDAEDSEVQITCVAKKLVVKSSDKETMDEKTLEELGLTPTAALVVEVKQDNDESPASEEESRGQSKLAQRAEQKKKKTGSHTMQSIGIYAKDDNAKGELVDGGAGVLYEQDVSDDEDEGDEPAEDGVDAGDDSEPEAADESDDESPDISQ